MSRKKNGATTHDKLAEAEAEHEESRANGVEFEQRIDGTRYLKCQLTPVEIDELREEREGKDTEIEQLQIDLQPATDRVKSIKSRIDILQEDGLRLSRRVRDGYEMRDVACQERRVDNEVVTIRLDTGEEVDRRPLTAEERQGKLFDAPAVLTAPSKKDQADLLEVD